MFVQHGQFRLVFVLLPGIVLAGVGCTDLQKSTRETYDRMSGREALEKQARAGVEAPGERIKELRLLAKEAPSRPQDEQEEVSFNLARTIKTEQDPLIRAEIIRTLGAFQTDSATAVLLAGLNDPDDDVRIACCDALGRRGGPQAIEALGKLIADDSNIDVRLAAARALGETEDQAAIAALAPGLDDPDPALQYRTVQSLQKVTGHRYGNDVNEWREFVAGRRATPPAPPSLAERFRQLF